MRNPNTLLFKAIETGDMNALERALESGADVDAKDPYRLTAAMLAADKVHANCLALQAKAWANLKANNSNGFTAPMMAGHKGHADCSHMAESELARRAPFP